MKLSVLAIFLLIACGACSQDDRTCSSADIMVMTKEEMKNELKLLFLSTAKLVGVSADEHCNCNKSTSTSEGDEAIEVYGKLDEKMNKNFDNLERLFEAKIAELETNISRRVDQLLQPVISRINELHRLGMSQGHPAASCKEVNPSDPESPSGYYWIKSDSGPAVRRYCNMTFTCGGITGGWMQVTQMDMTKSNSHCLGSLTEITDSSKRLCRKNVNSGCSNLNFGSDGIQYGHVCGRVIGYQYASTDAFSTGSASIGIDEVYIDGVSLTYGRSPRKHIWTFASSVSEAEGSPGCTCTNAHYTNAVRPSFVGNDYFCDTGSENRWTEKFYPDDPLWDGAGCGETSTCCSLNNPPWFFKQLPATTSESIDLRVCCNQPRNDEDIYIEIIDIFVR